MKIFRSIIFLFFCYSLITDCIAQTSGKAIKTATTTTVQFKNGNQYGKLNDGNWLKLNGNGFEIIKSKQVKYQTHDKSDNKGKWIVSDSSLYYDFTGTPYPSKMAHYKDSSIIIAGLDALPQPDTNRIFINRSTDRGESWQRIYQKTTADAQFEFYQIQHPTLSRIVSISKKFVKDSLGNYRKAYFLMNSNDTAASWTVNDSIFGIYDTPGSLNFNGKYGMIMKANPDTTILLYSENYGDSWTTYPVPADLRYGHGRVLGKGSILLLDKFSNSKLGYTSDITTGSWQFENLPDTFSSRNVYIRNKDTIWSATAKRQDTTVNLQRNIIVGTTDGGKTWQKPLDVFESNPWQTIGLNFITFATKNYGIALGYNVSYLTDDGGITWHNELLYDTLQSGPQVSFYYYNPISKKRLLMTLTNLNYVLKYKFDETNSLTELKDIESILKIYPNPVRDILFIEVPLELKLKNVRFQLLSIDGKLAKEVRPQSSNNNQFKIAIGNLPIGSYILQLKSENYTASQKFIVK